MIKGLSTFAIRHGLVPIAHWILCLYLLLVRIRIFREEELFAHLHRGGKGIIAVWHQRIFLVISYAQRFKDFTPVAMISKSRDGDLIADVARRLNFRPVRGSSSRGGREALAEMVAELSTHPLAVHAVDGPIPVPATLDNDAFDAIRLQIEKRMLDNQK